MSGSSFRRGQARSARLSNSTADGSNASPIVIDSSTTDRWWYQNTSSTRFNTHFKTITSSGISAIDDVLGGGFGAGSLCLIIMDTPTSYGDYLLTHFLAQGLISKHAIAIASADVPPQSILDALPTPRSSSTPKIDQNNQQNNNQISDSLRIAWRYKQLAMNSSTTQSKTPSISAHASLFDLNRPRSRVTQTHSNQEAISVLDLSVFDSTADESLKSSILSNRKQLCSYCGTFAYEFLIHRIFQHCRAATQSGLLSRIVIRSFDFTLLWKYQFSRSDSSDSMSTVNEDSECRCALAALVKIRGIARRCGAVVMFSVDRNWRLLSNARIHSDVVIQLESFYGRGTEEAGVGNHLSLIEFVNVKSYPGFWKHCGSTNEFPVLTLSRTNRTLHVEPANAVPETDSNQFDFNHASNKSSNKSPICASTSGASAAIDF